MSASLPAPAPERAMQHTPPIDVMYSNWAALTREVEPIRVPELPSPAHSPREQNADTRGVGTQPDRVGGDGVIASAYPKSKRSANARAIAQEAAKNARKQALAGQRKERMKQRLERLKTALEALFIARGWGIVSAQQFVGWWIADKLERAKRYAEKHGFDYLTGEWSKAS